MVTANGDLVTLSREKDGDTFLGSVVALGALGVVTKVTLDLQPAFWMQQNVYEKLPMDDIYEHFDEITSAGYSVSLFPTWQFDWSETVWVKQKLANHQPIAVPDSFFGATLGSNDRPVAPDYDRVLTRFGVAIPWHECLPTSTLKMRCGWQGCKGIFCAAPICCRCHEGGEQVAARAGTSSATEVRTWQPTNSGSACLRTGDRGYSFHSSKVGRRAGDDPLIEDAIAPLEPRPHWGKLFNMTPASVISPNASPISSA